MKRLLIVLATVLGILAVVVALLAVWLNVVLDGIHTNTCFAFAITVAALGAGAWVSGMIAEGIKDDDEDL